jgi:hypothetical protein
VFLCLSRCVSPFESPHGDDAHRHAIFVSPRPLHNDRFIETSPKVLMNCHLHLVHSYFWTCLYREGRALLVHDAVSRPAVDSAWELSTRWPASASAHERLCKRRLSRRQLDAPYVFVLIYTASGTGR